MAERDLRAAKTPAMSAQSQVCSLSSVLKVKDCSLSALSRKLSLILKPQPYQVIFCSHDSLAFCFFLEIFGLLSNIISPHPQLW